MLTYNLRIHCKYCISLATFCKSGIIAKNVEIKFDIPKNRNKIVIVLFS